MFEPGRSCAPAEVFAVFRPKYVLAYERAGGTAWAELSSLHDVLPALVFGRYGRAAGANHSRGSLRNKLAEQVWAFGWG